MPTCVQGENAQPEGDANGEAFPEFDLDGDEVEDPDRVGEMGSAGMKVPDPNPLKLLLGSLPSGVAWAKALPCDPQYCISLLCTAK